MSVTHANVSLALAGVQLKRRRQPQLNVAGRSRVGYVV